MHYAHSRPGWAVSSWQPLEEHLRNTAALAERFTAAFAPGWGHVAGLWHDAGKYRKQFQIYIGAADGPKAREGVDHKSVGAILAARARLDPLAFAIAGHHNGMEDREELRNRVNERAPLLDEARRDGLPPWLENQPPPAFPSWLTQKESVGLWTRFVLSTLADADFLDTERFYADGRERDLGVRCSVNELKARLDLYMAGKSGAAHATAMNEMRARVLAACRAAASGSAGRYTLTVPTGGGKTLASLTFALDHAVAHGLRRVIVVIPYTSIIEQTFLSFPACGRAPRGRVD